MKKFNLIHKHKKHILILLTLFFVVLFTSSVYAAINIKTLVKPKGQLRLIANKTSFSLGEPIALTLKNEFDSLVFMNNDCHKEPLSIYRWESDKWVNIHDYVTTAKCSNYEPIAIPANSTITINYANWPNLFNKVGKYRVAVLTNGSSSVTYSDFSISTPPKVAIKPTSKVTSTKLQIISTSQDKLNPTITPVKNASQAVSNSKRKINDNSRIPSEDEEEYDD